MDNCYTCNLDMNIVLKCLSEKRPIFHSESDFQHALACEIFKTYENCGCNIRLEKREEVNNKEIYHDIFIRMGNKVYIIELKYKTKQFSTTPNNNDDYDLKNQSAQDNGRYDFCKDIMRLEEIINTKYHDGIGFAIFLTNDHQYWKEPRRKLENLNDKAFRIHNGQRISGKLEWKNKPTTKEREQPIILNGSYELNWEIYSSCDNEVFKYLLVKVVKVNK